MKVDTDENQDLSSQLQVTELLFAHAMCSPHPYGMHTSFEPLRVACMPVLWQIQGLPTMVFVGVDKTRPALRTEGLMPALRIIDIIKTELLEERPIDVAAEEGVADVE